MTPEDAAALREFRRSRDPLAGYSPRGPTAERFHKSNARHKLLGGGNRTGKTATGLVDLSWLARGIHPYHTWTRPLRLWMWCQSRSQTAAVTGRKLFEKSELKGPNFNRPMIPSWEIEDLGKIKLGGINVYQRCLLRNGSEILFGFSGIESAWKRFQGLQLDGVAIDENSAEGDIINESEMRCADARGEFAETEPWRGFVYWFASGTQHDDNYTKFRQRCIDAEPGYEAFIINENERPPEVKREMDQIALTLTEEQRRIRVVGDSTATEELLIYARQWSDERHMRSSDYIVQPQDNLWCVIDPGVDHPTGIAFFAINAANPVKLRFVKFFLGKRMTAEEEVEVIKAFVAGRQLEGIIYDPAAHRTEKTGLSLKNQWANLLHKHGVRTVRGLIPGRNRHVEGINRVRSYLDPDPVNGYAEPLIEFNPSDESGCQMIRAGMLAYRSYEPNKFQGAKGVVKKDDEAVDCVRYACSLTPAYNPNTGCGFMLDSAPEPIPLMSEESIRLQRQFENSRRMSRSLESRDTGFNPVKLW